MATGRRPRVQAVNTTVSILETVQERGAAGVTELARALNMSKANVHKHLATLCENGFLIQDGEEYRSGLRLFEMGTTARDNRTLYREAAPNVQELAEVTNKVATLLIPAGDEGVYVRCIDPHEQSKPGDLEGVRRPLYETASGQAVLARLSADERSDRLPETLDKDRQKTLLANRKRIDESGVAMATLPRGEGLRELSSPVTVDGEPVGAIGLILDGAAQSSDQVEPSYAQLVKKTGKTLSKRMRLRRKCEA